MDRLACVDLPALPLQLLLRRYPDWGSHPVAVVDKDSPQGRISWVNERAHALRILPGQRYAAALSLSNDLRAGVVEPQEIDEGVARLTTLLRDFTPDVEPSDDEPGAFWLDASGLGRLFRSASHWGRSILGTLESSGFSGSVVVGFTRFGSYAVARSGVGLHVFRTAGDEEQTARGVRLDRLGFEPALRDALEKLGVVTLGQFLELPAQGLLKRFGSEAWRLHRMASGKLWTPLDPVEDKQPLLAHTELDPPDSDAERLLFLIKRLLDPLLGKLGERHRALRGLHLGLVLDDGEKRIETIRPADATRDAAQLFDLVRLRLESLRLKSGVVELELEVEEDLAPSDQFRLWTDNPRRDHKAADRALARLRAELGPAAVVRARVTEGHMPEAGFVWSLMEGSSKADPMRRSPSANDAAANGTASVGPAGRPLIRRMLQRPQPLPPQQHHLRDDGWLIRGSDYGAVSRFVGPFVISGGWWVSSVHRDYHFAETQRGDLLWVYFDRRRRRWFLQGHVE